MYKIKRISLKRFSFIAFNQIHIIIIKRYKYKVEKSLKIILQSNIMSSFVQDSASYISVNSLNNGRYLINKRAPSDCKISLTLGLILIRAVALKRVELLRWAAIR